MILRLLALVLTLGLVSHMNAAEARWDALSECNSNASQVNLQLPMEVDAVTTWTNVLCSAGGDGVIARYSYSLQLPASRLYPRFVKEAVYEGMINAWCTDPVQRELLEKVSIEAAYFRPDGSYITSFRVTSSMC